MKVGILLPVKNGEEYIHDSIRSVLEQTHTDFVLYISDDASTDKTVDIIKSFKDHRIRLFLQKKPFGQFENFNFLLKESKEELVHLWSHDDYMYAQCLAEVISFHHRFPAAGLSYCGSDTIDKNGKTVHKWTFDNTPEILNKKNYAQYSVAYGCLSGSISQITFNKKVTGNDIKFNGNLKHSGDFDILTRIAEKSDIGFIRQPLMAIRVHTRQITRQYLSNYFSVVESFPIVKHIIKWTDLREKEQKRVFRILYYPLYTDRMLFLLRHSYFTYAWQCLLFLIKSDNIIIITYFWIRYRLGFNQYWKMEKKKTLQRIFST